MPRSPLRLFRAVTIGLLGLAGTVAACRATEAPKTRASDADAGGSAASIDGGAAQPAHARASAPLFDDERPTGRLVAFRDEADVRAFVASWREQEDARRAPKKPALPMPGPADLDGGAPPAATAATPSPSPAKPGAAPAARRAAGEARADAKPAASESITNNQHAEVDEGDIVKLHGDHLVVLRRGRLFTLSLKEDRPRASATLDAFGPDIDPSGSWYDEMVIEGNDLVVVGFSYARGGTEIGLFRIDDAGRLTYRGTYHLKSNDYYSARNYASRIVDGRLVFYAPQYLSAYETDLTAHFPAVRHWRKDAAPSEFVRTLAPSRLFRVEDELPSTYAALHTVTSCDLRAPKLACESTGIIGPPGRVFYVSPSYVYVWMQDWSARTDAGSARPSGVVAKLPIRRGRGDVGAVRVSGMPTDQFSFEEDAAGVLNVLVRAQSNGDAMFASERTAGATALVRLPAPLFDAGMAIASPRRYRTLPRPDGYSVQNRFVGSWLLYGAGTGYVTSHQGGGQLHAVRYASDDAPITLALEQGVDRIEALGDDAVVVGSRKTDLVFSPLELGESARVRPGFVQKNASQGELRSHGFFYKPSAGGKARDGIVGLPIRSAGARGGRYLTEGSASVLFLANRDLELTELGALAASPLSTVNDGCRASCVDWYGNARPIFAKGRIFALMGYELVEGRLGAPAGDGRNGDGSVTRLVERSRLSFAPRGGPPAAEWD